MKRVFKDKFHIRATSIIIVLVLMFELVAATVTALTYYTVKINYLYIDGTPAHDPYIATYNPGTVLKEDVTNPTLSGFQPMALSDPNNDPADLPTGGVSAENTHIETDQTDGIDSDITKTVYYVAGLTHYAARYYLQNIYDDLYTLDRERTDANQNRLGQTGTTPDDLEKEKIKGFTSLFHEPDAIAADGSTVFRVYYDRNYYSINFDLGEDGYGVEPIYAKYQSVYRVDNPKRMGYTFLGWARTDNDSSKGEEGTDWRYLKPDAEPEIDDEGVYHYDEDDYYENETQARLNLVQFKDKDDLTVPAYNSYYKAIWTPGTTHFTVMYWIENEDNDGYTALLAKDVYQTKENNQMVDVHAGTTVDSRTVIRNYAEKAHQEGVYNSSTGCKNNVNITDLFSFNLNYADPDNALNKDPDPDDPDYDPDAFVYKYDTSGVPIDFKDISKGTSEELAGCGDFFEMNAHKDTSVDEKYRTDSSITVKGDGTSRFNVFFRRKRFTLKFYYARQGYTNGALDPNKISLTNSTKEFNNQSTEKEYLNTNSKNVLEAIAKGSWAPNSAETLPTVKDEYKQRVTEGYEDFVDNSGGYYRYFYYQWQAKYNEPLNEPLKEKWLIDALDTVHRKGSGEAEKCYPGSIATEYYNKYYQDRKSSGNYTVKGIYEKLDKGILFTDSARNTMKQNNIDYTKLHFLISWTNTSYDNGWNSSITRVLHFRYENYTELLPREIEILEHDGKEALLAEGNYTDVRQFTTKVKENDTYVEKTKWYGLSTNHVYETIDSGNQYDPGKDKTKEARKNQTPTQMTGFEIEYPRTKNGLITLDDYNTIVDWSQDTTNYRRCTIKFFYRRHEYTLKYRNGNHKDESRTRTVMYGAPINSTYQVSENGHEAGEYRYYWPDPEYFDKNRRNFFTFEGWYNDPRYEEPFDLDTQTMPADDDTLFAKWVPKSIDVIFYDDYDDYYSDRKGQHPENRVVLGKDKNNNDIRDINVDYGSYVPLMSIPVNGNDPDIPRPKLKPIAEGASFAGWYYIRNRVPVRFEPENVPITALNEESVGDNAKLRLFAEWVTKDVAKYKVKYVKAEDNNVEIAPPTTGRAYVWKTKTFNAKSGDELYDEYKWTQEGDQEGTNWWPTTNSSSMVIKANNSDDEYAPNNIKFEYIQKGKVHYKVQYLDAATRKPLNVEGEDVIKESTHASVTEDAKIIPGYIVRTATQSLTLTASSEGTPEEQQAEELQNNVITFLYDQNKNEYMYEVEYLTQDLGANTYSVHSSETLTVKKTGDGAVDLSVADLYDNEIAKHIEDSGYTRVSGETKYNVTNAEGVRNPTLNPVADNGTVEITGTDKKTIMIYYSRNSYRYTYQYIDQSAEKAYLENLKDDPHNTAGLWDGVLETFDDPSFTGQVQEKITINPDTDYTYKPGTDEQVDYTRVTDENGVLNDVTLTIQPENDWNIVKIYYRKDIERELHYKMVCVNNNSETDYYEDGTPKFGRLNFTMQTVLGYDGIKNNTFSSTNEEWVDVERKERLHLHRYTFLGWYTTPTYDEENPETNRITTNATLTKEDLPTGSDLPENKTKYYALVKQDMVKMDVMFYYVDDYTVDGFRNESDDNLAPRIQEAVNNQDNENVSDSDKVHLTGERVGKKVTFTSPNGFKNHNEIPWHLNDGYTLKMDDIDERVYKYEFAEWWTINEDNNNELTRKNNWNDPDGEWASDSITQQIARNKNQYLIAVYARRDDVTSLPYKINYNYTDRTGEDRTFVKKGTLTGYDLDESQSTCKITSNGDYRLTNEFIMANAPYESNHRQTITWSDAEGYISSTSEKNTSGSGPEGSLIANVTAKQTKKQVRAHYRTTADTQAPYQIIDAQLGDNYELNDEMRKIVAEETDSNGCKFSYWAVRKSEEGDVIAKGKRTQFDLCLLDDNYWISPVYEAAPRGSGEYNITLDPSSVANGDESWYAWTWSDGVEGSWVAPCTGTTFKGLYDKVKFVRVDKNISFENLSLNNIRNESCELLDIPDHEGKTYTFTGWNSTDDHYIDGVWNETPADEPSIKLTHIKYNRNRWTDDEGEIASSGDTDLLYTDFEIAFADNEKIQHSDDYQLGVVFELCATLPENATFDPSRDYNQVSDSGNLGDAIKNALDKNQTSGSYVYNTAKPSKRRNFQLSTISTSDITNRDRVEFAKSYKNAYKVVGEDTIQYTNSNQLMKATAYIIKDGKVTLSNSVYICLKAEAQKDLAVGNMPVETSGSTGN